MMRSLPFAIVSTVVLAPWAMAQDLGEVIAKHLEARGGVTAIRAVDTIRISGTLSMGSEIAAPIKVVWKRPNKLRLEFMVGGITGVEAFDGESGWRLDPSAPSPAPQPIPAAETRLLEEQADFVDGPFIDSEKKGYTIEYIGMEDIGGSPAHKLKITDKRGEVSYVFLDGATFLEIRSEGKRIVQEEEVEYETAHRDYRRVDGLMFAFSVENRGKGQPVGQTVTLETIELNGDVSDSEFVMPEPVPAGSDHGAE
jgi:outer membrane lipoprotein-sorting protein